jgi:hypothetical protein
MHVARFLRSRRFERGLAEVKRQWLRYSKERAAKITDSGLSLRLIASIDTSVKGCITGVINVAAPQFQASGLVAHSSSADV